MTEVNRIWSASKDVRDYRAIVCLTTGDTFESNYGSTSCFKLVSYCLSNTFTIETLVVHHAKRAEPEVIDQITNRQDSQTNKAIENWGIKK